ncbi:MAG: leucyl aminopeptidase [Halioglobus sp.]|nr:leucyl aminopeptidase [Halioglobus sp.]
MPAISFSARKIPDAAARATQCAVLPMFSGEQLSPEALQLDEASGGAISALLKLGDFTGKKGETFFLPGAGSAKRILLVGCGKAKKFDRAAMRGFCDKFYEALKNTRATEATLHLPAAIEEEQECRWFISYLARYLVTANYRYTETVAKPKPAAPLARLVVNCAEILAVGSANSALSQGESTGQGVNEARNLANLPGNICTPTYLASQARKLSRRYDNLSTSVLDEKKMRELGMGALLSVSAGSRQPARLIIMNYRGGKASQRPYVLVGKGITFDTGGISLKPGPKMDEMKYDMCGAASVFGTMIAAAELQLPLNIVGIIAAAENMPGGGATKPGDVVTSMAGKTIEILNTDAEGRLVLCDALTYVARFKPEAVIDIATLTGACVVALGSHATGLFANDDKLADQLLEAGTQSHDRAWRMPLWPDYQKQLDSNFADVANVGGPAGGSITAACFLARFTEDYTWAHLDIAGAAWDSTPKGATGRPVALLTRYLLDRAGRAG